MGADEDSMPSRRATNAVTSTVAEASPPASAAHAALAPGGRLYLVANRTLPYERLIAECFGEVRTAHDGRRFKVIGGVRRG